MTSRRALGHRCALAVLASLAGCDPGPGTPALRQLPPPGAANGRGVLSPAAALPQARIPSEHGRFAPSLMRVAAPAPVDVARLADVQTCEPCHEAQTRQWRQSAHAHASFDNPWYRTSVDHLRDEVGLEASRHCGGCHDPLLLLSDGMTAPVAPEDPLSTAGITCLICHSASEANPDGNGSLALTGAPVPMPEPGDAESLARHRARLSLPPLRTVRLCGACHRGFLGPDTGNQHHLFGMDDLGAWGASAFAGSRADTLEPFPERSCRDCHMDPPQAAGARAERMPSEGHARQRANVLCLLGRIAARQGRVAAAEALADRAEQLVGREPAVLRVRADANLQVWRFDRAERALRALVARCPRDTAAHRDLARARLSLRDHAGALAAARQGLSLQPRDEGLLRVQAVALEKLGHPAADAARAAYLRYRAADEDTRRKLACDRRSPTCARDRMPVVTLAASAAPR